MNCIVLARTVNTLIRTRVKRWHFLQGARRALWTQITAIKSSGMDTNWDSTLQKLSIPPFLWKPGMGKQRSTGQAPSSPAFKIGPEGYVFYIVLHLDVACPKFCIFKNLKEMINFWIYVWHQSFCSFKCFRKFRIWKWSLDLASKIIWIIILFIITFAKTNNSLMNNVIK